MTVKLPRRRATLKLPVMPRRFGRGDKRNYLRWHAWVEAVRVLAQHYRDDGSRRPNPGGRRA
jgi:hypothetical protein